MKKLILGIFALLLFSSNSFGQGEKMKIDDLSKKVVDHAITNKKIVTFNADYSRSDDMYILSNVKLETETEWINGFSQGWDPKAFEAERRNIVITCTTNRNTTQTNCGSNDGGCVGSAIKRCLDGGGCAGACSAGRYVP